MDESAPMSTGAIDQAEKPPVADGKRRLVEAALRLSARGAALSGLGLRELAREAGLNHNTFYRHFDHIDELGEAAARQVAAHIMVGMKVVRQNAMSHPDVNRAAAEYFFAFVQQNPAPFIVGLREAHSIGTPMRTVIQQVMDQIAEESVEQITSMNLAPGLDGEALLRATSAITYYLFYRALDCIENPEQQEAIVEQVVDFVRMQFLGAAALQQLNKSAS
jgi:AcrR family transcriptional regulator